MYTLIMKNIDKPLSRSMKYETRTNNRKIFLTDLRVNRIIPNILSCMDRNRKSSPDRFSELLDPCLYTYIGVHRYCTPRKNLYYMSYPAVYVCGEGPYRT